MGWDRMIDSRDIKRVGVGSTGQSDTNVSDLDASEYIQQRGTEEEDHVERVHEFLNTENSSISGENVHYSENA